LHELEAVSVPRPPATVASVLLTGTLTRYVLLGVNIAIGLALMPFTVSHLGKAQYGLWMLVASMTYYFQLLDLGYGSGLVRQISEADARGDTEQVNRVLSTFVLVYGALGLTAGLGLAVLIFGVLPHFPNLADTDLPTAQRLLAIIGLRVVLGFPMSVFGAATTARQRFALNNTVAIVLALLQGAVTYLVLVNGHGLLPLVTATTALSISGYLAYAWTARRAFPELDLKPSWFSRSIVREVSSFSLYFFLIDVAIQIGFNLDNLVVGGFLGTGAVAVYAVALRLADYQRQLANQFNGLLLPVVVRFGAVGREAALRTTLVEGTRVALLLVGGVTVCLIGFAEPLVTNWMGPEFTPSVPPLIVLALTGVVLVGQGPTGNVLLGTGRHRLVAWVSLGEALANLLISLLLVVPLGLLGVAIGTAIPIVIANLGILVPAGCRAVGTSMSALLREVLRAPFAGVVPASMVCALLRVTLPPASLGAVVLQGAFVGLVYLAGALLLGLPRDTRRRYWNQLVQAGRGGARVPAAPLGESEGAVRS
jgi:O-antigen/teichoic acid export membrane protein